MGGFRFSVLGNESAAADVFYMGVTTFKDLHVWQRSMELVKEIYLITQKLPANEQFGLSSQMQRAAVSIPSNIAEGHQRSSAKDYVRFLYISYGSLAELDTLIGIVEQQFLAIPTDVARTLLTRVGQMLNRLIVSLESKSE